MTADELKRLLGLQPLEREGGWFAETYRAPEILPAGEGRGHALGADLAAGMRPQVLVPRGVWQGMRLIPGGRVALLGTTVSPGFDPEDYQSGEREALVRAYPAFRQRIVALTR